MRIAAVAVVSGLVGWVAVAIALALGDAPTPPAAPVATAAPQRPPAQSPPERSSGAKPRPEPKVPSAAAVRSAARFAAARDGEVAFAVVNSEERLRGFGAGRRFSAASTVKAMLLIAELRRLEREAEPLDAETDALLNAMITVSDNSAADAIHARVGDPGMFAVAREAGMARFTEAGHWGNAQVSAGDLALLFADLDALLPKRFRAYGLGLLGSVSPEQSWGIPEVARPEWAVRFKGGWLPDRGLAHQAAQLRNGARELAIAVLTDAGPSFDYATETVRGVADRLLSGRGFDRGA
jgi:hypothetical protein